MKQTIGILLFASLLTGAFTASTERYIGNRTIDYSETDTLDLDSIAIEEIYPDTIAIADDIDFEIISADQRYDSDTIVSSDDAGRILNVTDQSGAKYKIEVNSDGIFATLKEGDANGVSTLNVPFIIESGERSYFIVTIDKFAFATFSTGISPMKGVKNLVIPEGIQWIGQNAFDCAPDLENVSFSATLRNIPYCIFNNCKKLRNINISEESRITEIGTFAFSGCESLETFCIPANVSKIGEGPWRGCTSLEKLSLQDENSSFVVHDGVLYRGWQDKLIQYPAGKKNKSYRPMYGTKKIGNSAFYGNPYIEEVTMPASVDSISHIAFYDCKRLKKVVFSDHISFIGNNAFSDCPELQQITFYGNPEYTDNLGDTYNTFAGTPIVINILEKTPKEKLKNSKKSILEATYDHISNFDGFMVGEIESNESYGFPDFFGKGRWTVYGNAGPKKDVMNVLDVVPAKYLALETFDNRNRIRRFYLDSSDKKNPRLLYFFGGIGGNDLVVALFEGGDLKKIESFIEDEKRR